MIQIAPDQIPPGFSAMFQRSAPTGIRALAVLASGNAGKFSPMTRFTPVGAWFGKRTMGLFIAVEVSAGISCAKQLLSSGKREFSP